MAEVFRVDKDCKEEGEADSRAAVFDDGSCDWSAGVEIQVSIELKSTTA